MKRLLTVSLCAGLALALALGLMPGTQALAKDPPTPEADQYHGGNDVLDLYIGEMGSSVWYYNWDGVHWGESCYWEEYSIWYGGSIHQSTGFTVLDLFGATYNDPDRTAVLQSGPITITRSVMIPTADLAYFQIAYRLENTGGSILQDVRFFEKIDYDVPSTSGGWGDIAWYDAASDTVWVTDPDYFQNGFTGNLPSARHGVANWFFILNEDDTDGSLNNANNYGGDPGVALQYNIDPLVPGGSWEVTMRFFFGEPPSPPPTRVVGGTVTGEDTFEVLMPWLALAGLIILGGTGLVMRRRRGH